MKTVRLPPNQREVKAILRWNIDHPGIIPENPRFDPEKWALIIDGEIANPLRLSWRELLNLSSTESTSDFHCVEGWSVRDCRWCGVKFSSLVEIAKPTEDVKYVYFKCLDGYTTSLDLSELLPDDVMLAYRLNGEYLEEALGGPLRLIVPAKYAYKSAMWVERTTFTKTKEFGYWERRGYSDTADVWRNDRFAR